MSRENLAASDTAASAPSGSARPHAAFAGLSPAEFKLAFRNHAAGVALITADPGTGPVALTATSVFSVSAEPPLFVFSLSSASSSSPAIQASETLVVHLLGAEQLDLARLGSTSGIDRFADTSIWSRLPTGEPYFPGASAWIRGTVINRMEAGSSTIVAVHALEAHVPDDSDATAPLVYHNRTWHHLGEHSRLG